MITKELTYRNVFDKQVTKTLYFGFTRAELLELEAEWNKDGGVKGRYEMVEKAGPADEPKLIIETFKTLIGRSYGERVGDEFEKSSSITNRFLASDAYSEVLFNILQSPDPEWDANVFMRGILPKNVDLDNLEADPSEVARKRSEAQMQGFQKKDAADKDEAVFQVPVEPTESEAQKRARLYQEFKAKQEADKLAAQEPVDPEFEEFLRNNA